jgi:hypothetical protein
MHKTTPQKGLNSLLAVPGRKPPGFSFSYHHSQLAWDRFEDAYVDLYQCVTWATFAVNNPAQFRGSPADCHQPVPHYPVMPALNKLGDDICAAKLGQRRKNCFFADVRLAKRAARNAHRLMRQCGDACSRMERRIDVLIAAADLAWAARRLDAAGDWHDGRILDPYLPKNYRRALSRT